MINPKPYIPIQKDVEDIVGKEEIELITNHYIVFSADRRGQNYHLAPKLLTASSITLFWFYPRPDSLSLFGYRGRI